MIFTSEWVDGYVFDIPYTANFYYQQTPDFLNFCTLLSGIEPPEFSNGFKYLELGSGMGFNLNAIASMYPEGDFYGVDFNPEHIRFSNKIKNQAGLKNVEFFEMSFEEVLNQKIDEFPMFDYITLHGIFSWVSKENRDIIVRILKNKLKPGGICYITYNDMCGWFNYVPLQRLLLDYSKLFPDIGSIAKINMGINLAKRLKESGSVYFNSPFIEKILEKFEKDRKYVVHEYLNEDWQPLFFTQVLSHMKHAKVQYVGQGEPIWYFDNLFLNKKQQELLNGLRSQLLREVVKDFIVRMSFRKDIYIKGTSPIPPPLVTKRIKQVRVFLRLVSMDKRYKIKLPYANKNANIDPEFLERLVEILSENIYTIGELMDIPELGLNNIFDFLRTISILLHSRTIDLVLGESKTNNVADVINLNKVVAKESRYKNILRQFCIPKSRSGIAVNLYQRLVYDGIVNKGINDVSGIISHVYSYLNGDNTNNKLLKKDIEGEILECIEKVIPEWKRIGIIAADL